MCSCVTVVSVTKIKAARKDHLDDAGTFINEMLYDLRIPNNFGKKITFTEWRMIATLKANCWKIKKGQAYESSFCVMDNYGYTFRSRKEVLDFVYKFDLMPCDC